MTQPDSKRLEALDPDLVGLPTVTQFERELGLSRGTLYNWVKRNGGQFIKVGKFRLVPLRLQERYLRETKRLNVERAPCRPRDWLGLYQAQAMAGCSISMIWNEVLRGNIRAVRVGYINYYHPDDVRHLAQRLKNKPLPGWVSVREMAKSAGASLNGAVKRLRALGYPLRKFRQPGEHQLAWYTTEEGAEAWRRWIAGFNKTLPRNRPVRKCPQCGVEYRPERGWKFGRFCSCSCKNRADRAARGGKA
jgi:hypothetical protein